MAPGRSGGTGRRSSTRTRAGRVRGRTCRSAFAVPADAPPSGVYTVGRFKQNRTVEWGLEVQIQPNGPAFLAFVIPMTNGVTVPPRLGIFRVWGQRGASPSGNPRCGRRGHPETITSLALAKCLRCFFAPSPECSGEGGRLRIAK